MFGTGGSLATLRWLRTLHHCALDLHVVDAIHGAVQATPTTAVAAGHPSHPLRTLEHRADGLHLLRHVLLRTVRWRRANRADLLRVR